jgi:hypothetical protein
MILPDVDTPNTLGGDQTSAGNLRSAEFRAQAGLCSV